MHSRVAGDPDWGAQADALRDLCHRPRLVNRLPLPDLPDPCLRRVLTGHQGAVTAVVLAPDGSWLAAASGREVRIWDPATGQVRAILPAGGYRFMLATAPDGSWLAAASGREVRVWDPATGEARAILPGHKRRVSSMATAPDGSWLAAASGREVRVWDPATGEHGPSSPATSAGSAQWPPRPMAAGWPLPVAAR